MSNRRNAEVAITVFFKRNFIMSIICLSLFPGFSSAQSVGDWTFNNILTATPGSHNTASAVSHGSAISTGAFNGGTVYFGEDGWPSGALDANAYLQFTLTPGSGYTLTLSALVMNIRRSTTGTGGSGPNNWSLRSSLDGFTVNISSGVLTTSSTPATTVVLPAAFTGLTSAVTFRLYGYNATIGSGGGGLNRFVYDNLTTNGAVILPIVINDFKIAVVHNDAVQLAWTLEADESVNSMQVERSSNNNDFTVIKNYFPDQNLQQRQYEFVDESTTPANGDFYYRIKVMSMSGKISYSAIQKITIAAGNNFSITGIATHQGENIKCKVLADQTGNYQFSVYALNGARVSAKSISLTTGGQLVRMDNGSLVPGMYIIVAERTVRKISSKIIVE